MSLGAFGEDWRDLEKRAAPMSDNEIDTIDAMTKYGGGFVAALGRAWSHADPENHRRLQAAFPEYWRQYHDIARAERRTVEDQ